MINYYKWEALISFLREKDGKNTSEGKKEKEKIRSCVCLHESQKAAIYLEKIMGLLYHNALMIFKPKRSIFTIFRNYIKIILIFFKNWTILKRVFLYVF